MRRQLLATLIFLFNINIIYAMPEAENINKKDYTASRVCGKCHTEIYKFWKNSLHALSIDDPIFNVAYMQSLKQNSDRAKKYCLRCHAPVVIHNSDYELQKDVTKEGVSCDFCHTVKALDLDNERNPFKINPGVIKRSALKTASPSVHKVEYSEIYARSEFCAGCHELKGMDGVVILGTYSEWKEGPYPAKGINCQNCHMPKVEGRVVDSKLNKDKGTISLHDIQGGHSITQLKKAVDLEITRINKTDDGINVEVKLKNVGSGHCIPTGIPSRKLVLEVSLTVKDKVVDTQRIEYEKVVADSNGKQLTDDWEIMMNGAKIISDNRLKPMEERIESFSFHAPKSYEGVVNAGVYYIYTPYILDRKEMKVEMNSVEMTTGK